MSLQAGKIKEFLSLDHDINFYYYYLIELQMGGFTRWQWYYNKTPQKNTHVTQNNTTGSNKIQHTKLYKKGKAILVSL
jgi:hypothetical protein